MTLTLARSRPLLLPALLCGLFILWLTGPTAEAGEIRGTVAYRERIALTPGARLEVTLEDVSLADAPAKTVAKLALESPGQPPIAFSLRYDDQQIDPARRYALRARIMEGEQLLFTTDTLVPVLTDEDEEELKLLLHMPSSVVNSATAAMEDLPASFEGVLSCAACEGIRHHLNLLPNRVWYLRQTWLGGNDTPGLDQLGRWEVDEERRALRLVGASEAPMMLGISNEDGLLKLDIVGQLRESRDDRELRRQPAYKPFVFRGLARGMYAEDERGASFTECLSGQRWQLTDSSEQRALHAAYQRLKLPAGQASLATMEAELPTDGKPDSLLVIREYDGLWPAESCVLGGTPPPLENTYWKLTRLDGKGVRVGDDQGQAHLILKAPNELTGFGGCNRLAGRYALKGGKLTLRGTVATRMACINGMDQEAALLKALKATSTWSVEGQYLHLFDEGGRQAARFEAVYLR